MAQLILHLFSAFCSQSVKCEDFFPRLCEIASISQAHRTAPLIAHPRSKIALVLQNILGVARSDKRAHIAVMQDATPSNEN